MMTVRTKFIAFIVLVNLAVAVAGLMIVPSLRSDQTLEPNLRARANRISMSVVMATALREAHYQAVLAQYAVDAGTDPAPALRRLEQELDGSLGQLRFLPPGPLATEVSNLLTGGAVPIKALLQQQPLTPAAAAELSALTLDLQQRAGRAFAALLEENNTNGLAEALSGLGRLRDQLGIALGSVAGALLLSMGLSIFAYRRLIKPLGAVTGSLNAVLTGHQPSERLQETRDEFGDIVRAIRKLQAQAEHIRRIAASAMRKPKPLRRLS
jgi:methyl-accepting chemotaxis protein